MTSAAAALVSRALPVAGLRPALAQALLVVALAWGALAFGAVYPWAYWPLAAGLLLFAVLMLTQKAPSIVLPGHAWLGASFAAIGTTGLLQLVPLPLASLERLSPETHGVLQKLSLAVATGATSTHAISIDPPRTMLGIILFAVLALLVLASARLISLRGPRGLAELVALLGVVLAMAGIIQRSLALREIYGFWQPQSTRATPFGPFVNRNHFAGWMLMALPLTLGLLCGGIARAMRGVKPEWRERLLWFSSPAASRLLLVAGAAIVMALSLVLTLSRSGILAMALATTATGIVALRRQRTATRRTIAVGYVALLLVAVVAWVGADTIVTRFSNTNWSEFNERRGAWQDAAAIAQRFPLVGTGLNTYGVATLFFQQHDLTQHYAEAHNDYLQLAAEGGALLVVPCVIGVTIFAVLVRRRFREDASSTSYWLRIGAVTGLLAMALQETVEFSLQMPGNAALFAVLCGMALHRVPGAQKSDLDARPAPPSAVEGRPYRGLTAVPARGLGPSGVAP